MIAADDRLAAELYQRWLYSFAFRREERRRTLLKRLCDCGCWIDGGEPYRYQVWRLNVMPAGVIEQRTDCEFCARVDNRY